MRPAPGLLLLLLLAPAAQACDIAFDPFEQPSWDGEGDLRFVEGDKLLRVRDGRESTVAQGFFMTYADGDGGLVIAGQEGLGADCTGIPWLRADGFERSGFDGNARVMAHEDGPRVAYEGRLWRWADGDLHETEWTLPEHAYLQGVTAEGGPVYRQGETIVVGKHSLPLSTSDFFEVGHNATHTAIVVSSADDSRILFVAADGNVTTLSWPAGGHWRAGVAWTGAEWAVAAGGRAFLVAGSTVTDLGVEASTVGARGPQAVAFHQGGYTVFVAGRAVERWTRGGDGAWTLGAPPLSATPSPVSATASQTAAGEAPDVPARGKGAPALPLAAALAALAAGLALRRRFEP